MLKGVTRTALRLGCPESGAPAAHGGLTQPQMRVDGISYPHNNKRHLCRKKRLDEGGIPVSKLSGIILLFPPMGLALAIVFITAMSEARVDGASRLSAGIAVASRVVATVHFFVMVPMAALVYPCVLRYRRRGSSGRGGWHNARGDYAGHRPRTGCHRCFRVAWEAALACRSRKTCCFQPGGAFRDVPRPQHACRLRFSASRRMVWLYRHCDSFYMVLVRDKPLVPPA